MTQGKEGDVLVDLQLYKSRPCCKRSQYGGQVIVIIDGQDVATGLRKPWAS